MTDDQRKRIHEILYSTQSREELAKRIVALEDERNHWHVEQTHAYSNWEDVCKQAKELESENAKLRELVQGLWFAAQYLGMNPDGATGSGFVRQMRELGIEVSDV